MTISKYKESEDELRPFLMPRNNACKKWLSTASREDLSNLNKLFL